MGLGCNREACVMGKWPHERGRPCEKAREERWKVEITRVFGERDGDMDVDARCGAAIIGGHEAVR